MNDPKIFRLSAAGCLLALLAVDAAHVQAQTGAGTGAVRDYVGAWEGEGHGGAYHGYNLNADGSWTSGGSRAGVWGLDGNQLVLRFTAHPGWQDAFDLPARNGVLNGRDASGATVTLTRHAGATPARAAATTVADGGYFGTRTPIASDATTTQDAGQSDPAATSGVVIPTPAPPVFATRPPGTRAVAVRPTPPAASTPPMEAAVVLTPVGRWRWHSGAERNFDENGSVMEGSKVIGQWKWADKGKGEVQVNWSGTHARAETYVLSPHNHHLSHTDAEGHVFTNDRLD